MQGAGLTRDRLRQGPDRRSGAPEPIGRRCIATNSDRDLHIEPSGRDIVRVERASAHHRLQGRGLGKAIRLRNGQVHPLRERRDQDRHQRLAGAAGAMRSSPVLRRGIATVFSPRNRESARTIVPVLSRSLPGLRPKCLEPSNPEPRKMAAPHSVRSRCAFKIFRPAPSRQYRKGPKRQPVKSVEMSVRIVAVQVLSRQ